MKYLASLIFILTSLFCFSEENNDPDLFSDKDRDLIDKLEESVGQSMDEIIKIIPNEIREETLKLKSKNDYYKSKEIDLWYRTKAIHHIDVKVHNKFENIISKYYIHSDDIFDMLLESFIDKVNKREIDLESKIRSSIIYWRENSTPPVKISPEGGGEIKWIWTLPTDERQSGILHVGIDAKARRFVCYERTKGNYFPEGLVMERINAEIVQNPEVASDHVGKGYLEKIKPK